MAGKPATVRVPGELSDKPSHSVQYSDPMYRFG